MVRVRSKFHLGALPVLLLCLAAVLFPAERILPLEDGWFLQSSILAGKNGAELSTSSYLPKDWYPVRVPSTVLNALVRNGVYPDPAIGMNNMLIPDASEEFSAAHGLKAFSHLPGNRNPWKDGYWYRTSFSLPDLWKGKHVFLNLEGINYRAEIWVNGRCAADSRAIAGMFGRWRNNISDLVEFSDTNTLAVLILPLDYPGLPAEPQLKAFGPFGLNGGPTGDIGKNVTMHCSVGWDWIPAVRDRNMGIWQAAFLSVCGPVDIRSPRIVTDLPLPETDRAEIHISTELINLTDISRQGRIEAVLRPAGGEGETVHINKSLEILPGQALKVVLAPEEFPELRLSSPGLWWPNGMGEQLLYDLKLSFIEGDSLSDEVRARFGIREVSSRLTEVDGWGRRDFFINGKKMLIRGGAWVPDLLLARDQARLAAELRLLKEANLNLVRIWGGGPTPPEAFFSLCDEMGLSVWFDFWITGDCQGTWDKGSRDYPYDAGLFLKNASDVVKALRNHPCLIVWTAGNEGYPRAEIYRPLRSRIIAGLDGTRPFIPSSGYRAPPEGWGLSWPDDLMAGTYSGGPYRWVPPRDYYEKVDKGQDWLFKNEVGLPSLPVLETIRKFIPDLTPDPEVPFPLNHIWGYHDACEGNGKFSLYDQAVRRRYGEPESLEDYLFQAQLVNAENYRAIFEAVNHRADRTAGVILWKANPAWPSVIWQLYDWYLRPNAGYYFTQTACEPLHIQMNLDDFVVTVVNTTRRTCDKLTAESRLYNLSGEEIWAERSSVRVESGRAVPLYSIPIPEEGVSFIKLRLRGRDGGLLSENFYWMSASGNFSGLDHLSKVSPKVEILHESGRKEEAIFTLRISNPTDGLAFFMEMSIHPGPQKPELLPSFWETNYISLLPGESRTLQVSVPFSIAGEKRPFLKIKGWNIPEIWLPLVSQPAADEK